MAQATTKSAPTGPARTREMAETLERIAWLMDRAFTIPGTKVRVGLDALLGLLPIGGDVATGLVQVGVVLVALAHYKVPKAVAARMMANVLLDVGVGAIPVLGDLFDMAFKANTRNLKLLEPYRMIDVTPAAEPPKTFAALPGVRIGMSWRLLFPFAILMLVLLGLLLVGFVTVVKWAMGY